MNTGNQTTHKLTHCAVLYRALDMASTDSDSIRQRVLFYDDDGFNVRRPSIAEVSPDT